MACWPVSMFSCMLYVRHLNGRFGACSQWSADPNYCYRPSEVQSAIRWKERCNPSRGGASWLDPIEQAENGE